MSLFLPLGWSAEGACLCFCRLVEVPKGHVFVFAVRLECRRGMSLFLPSLRHDWLILTVSRRRFGGFVVSQHTATQRHPLPAFSADGEAKLSASGKLQGNIKNTSTFMLHFLNKLIHVFFFKP